MKLLSLRDTAVMKGYNTIIERIENGFYDQYIGTKTFGRKSHYKKLIDRTELSLEQMDKLLSEKDYTTIKFYFEQNYKPKAVSLAQDELKGLNAAIITQNNIEASKLADSEERGRINGILSSIPSEDLNNYGYSEGAEIAIAHILKNYTLISK